MNCSLAMENPPLQFILQQTASRGALAKGNDRSIPEYYLVLGYNARSPAKTIERFGHEDPSSSQPLDRLPTCSHGAGARLPNAGRPRSLLRTL
jgi:hypothetical protein